MITPALRVSPDYPVQYMTTIQAGAGREQRYPVVAVFGAAR